VQVTVDLSKCENNGLCAMAASDVFRQREDGSLEIIDSSPPDSLRYQVEQAVNYCPQGAITIS